MKQHFETTLQKILHPKIWRKLPWERIWAPESGNFVTFIVTFRQDKTRQDQLGTLHCNETVIWMGYLSEIQLICDLC